MTKSTSQQLCITSTQLISPNMRRIQLSGKAIVDYPQEAEGYYVKLAFPRQGDLKPLLRTYIPSAKLIMLSAQ